MVNILSSVEISDNDYGTTSQEQISSDSNEVNENTVGNESEDSDETIDEREGNKKAKKDSSLLSSTIFFGSVLIVMGIIYWVVKRRNI